MRDLVGGGGGVGMARLYCFLGWIELLHGVDNEIHLICDVARLSLVYSQLIQ
jgi:hypothetical protein